MANAPSKMKATPVIMTALDARKSCKNLCGDGVPMFGSTGEAPAELAVRNAGAPSEQTCSVSVRLC